MKFEKQKRPVSTCIRHGLALLLVVVMLTAAAGCSSQELGPTEVSPAEPENGSDTPVTDEVTEEELAEPAIFVTASFFPYADLARQIGGSLVEIHQLVPDGADPHSFEPSPRDLIKLESSQIFIYNGLDMEPWLEGALALLENQEARLLQAADMVSLLSYGEKDHDHDDKHDHEHDHDHDHDDDHDHDHGEWDPHIWTDPLNMVTIGSELLTVFQELDPANSDIYEENYHLFAAAIEELDEAFRQMAQTADQQVLLVSHSAFGYFAHRYGFQEIAVTGITPHAEPNPGRLAELTNLAREYKLEYIFFETLANPRTAEVLAAEAGLKPLMLHNLEGLNQEQREAGATYLSLMQENLKTLEKALVK
ncbi:metal ABC transporter substrate-binding protein [Anoxynatronum buryatiense]|uniref:Zinc transport system substrate-binding protein n=1 Tax=Anoxynatronum buryatiense TaxID=489973 RepID=A0AA46AJU1_9CLOT|nr:zinc ABC transporter substrate-binding protein [Anoxynatronum buryatiense]SMP62984.1 zinc transport system substrate-binding protein [Anoxynatronum buryatiense]